MESVLEKMYSWCMMYDVRRKARRWEWKGVSSRELRWGDIPNIRVPEQRLKTLPKVLQTTVIYLQGTDYIFRHKSSEKLKQNRIKDTGTQQARRGWTLYFWLWMLPETSRR